MNDSLRPLAIEPVERIDALHRGPRALAGAVVVGVGVHHPSRLFVGDLAHDLRRHAGDDGPLGHLEIGTDEGERGDDRPGTDHRAVHHHGVHADQRVVGDRAAVQHGAVAHRDVGADRGLASRVAMDRAVVLDVGTLADPDLPEIAAQARGRRDVTARPDDHVADQDGGLVDIGRGMDDGRTPSME